MQSDWRSFDPIRMLVAGACIVVIVAGMRAASPILVPFLLALFLAILCMPLLTWMLRLGMSNHAAVLVLMTGVTLVCLGVVGLVGTSLTELTLSLPDYQERLSQEIARFTAWLGRYGIEMSEPLLPGDPTFAIRVAGNLLSGFTNMLTNTLVILMIVLFLLLEAAGFPSKLSAAFPRAHSSEGLKSFIESVNRYMAIKSSTSLGTGLLAGMLMWAVGADFSLLWGLLAFLLNYVPNIGSILAGLPACLFVLVTLGLPQALLAAGGYVLINLVIGNFVEPRVMGQGLGLSTLVVVLSLIFWGWVLGPAGMFLSVPLTMIVKIGLGNRPETRWVAVLLGQNPGTVQEAEG